MTVTPLTAMQAIDADRPRKAAMGRLLHRLKRFMETMPLQDDDKMPEHDIVWMAYPDGGPEATILDAIKANPALWAHAVPDDCVIVPKEMLQRVMEPVPPTFGLQVGDMVEALAHQGAHLIESHAARARFEQEEAERQRERI